MDISCNFVMSVTTTKFQFYAEKVVRDIQVFVIVHQCPHCDVTSNLICIYQNLE